MQTITTPSDLREPIKYALHIQIQLLPTELNKPAAIASCFTRCGHCNCRRRCSRNIKGMLVGIETYFILF